MSRPTYSLGPFFTLGLIALNAAIADDVPVWRALTDPPVADAPDTDYASLVKEMMKDAVAPVFTKRHAFNITLPSPETATIADGGQFLCSHDVANEKLDVWDLKTGKLAHTWKCGPLANARCFAISPTGKTLAVGREDHMVVTYDIASGKPVHEHNMLAREGKKVFRVAVNWQDDRVFFVGEEGDLWCFPVGGGEGRGQQVGTSKTFVPWTASDPLPYMQISGKGAAGIMAHPTLVFSVDFASEKTFFSIGHPQEPILAFTPIHRGMVRWDGINKGFRIHQPTNEKGIPANPVTRGAFVRTLSKQVAVDRGERFAWCYGQALRQPVLDIYSLDDFELPQSVTVPEPSKPFQAKDREWIAPESKRLIRWCDADKEVTIFELGTIEPLPSWKVYGTIHRLFLEKKYDRLDGVVAALREHAVIPGGSHVPMLTDTMESFHEPQMYVEPWEWEQRLEAWVEERPNCELARLALANYRINEGWAARGVGFAGDVTEEGWAKLLAMGEDGNQLLAPLMKQPKPPAEAFFLQLRVAKMLGRGLDEQLELAERLLEIVPDYAPFHNEMVGNLLPRWFGTPGASGAYADKVAKQVGGDKGESLYAAMGFTLMRSIRSKDFVEESGVDVKRLAEALASKAQRNPDDDFYRMRFYGFALYGQRANPEAFDPPMQAAVSEANARIVKDLDKLTWNPYVVHHCHFLQWQFEMYRQYGVSRR